jgi:uncharacterized membrane protein YhdT
MAELGWKFWLTMTSVVLVILLALGLGETLDWVGSPEWPRRR